MDMNERTRRHVLALSGTGAATALAGCASAIGGLSGDGTTSRQSTRRTTAGTTRATTQSTTEETTADGTETTQPPDVDISEPDVFSSQIPLPERPGDYEYAVMGDPDGTPTATVVGNWKCPYTQAFVRNLLPELVEEYVTAGEAAIEYRTLAYMDDEPFLGPDAPRAARAGLAAWNVDPSAYWSYFAYVFDNQPPEEEAWAQPGILERFAEAADVGPVEQFRQGFTSDAYAPPVEATSARARELGIQAIPRVVANGTVTAPTVDPDRTRRQFERLVSDDDGNQGQDQGNDESVGLVDVLLG